MLCPQKSLSDIVPSIKFYFQKFKNAKSSALVKFIDNSTFITENNEDFMIIKDTAWDESNQRIFFASESCSLIKSELRNIINKKQVD
jgi:hypothetical protein